MGKWKIFVGQVSDRVFTMTKFNELKTIK